MLKSKYIGYFFTCLFILVVITSYYYHSEDYNFFIKKKLNTNNKNFSIRDYLSKFDKNKIFCLVYNFSNNEIYTNNDLGINDRVFKPGSIFKIILAIEILKNPRLLNNIYFCDGKLNKNSKTYFCWNRNGHGLLNFKDAFINSCNLFFINLIEFLDLATINNLFNRIVSENKKKINFIVPVEKDRQVDYIMGNLNIDRISLMDLLSILVHIERNKNTKPYLELINLLRECVKTGTANKANITNYDFWAKTGTINSPDEKYGLFAGVFINKLSNSKYAIIVANYNGLASTFSCPEAKNIAEFIVNNNL